jgi:hypothetical protein
MASKKKSRPLFEVPVEIGSTRESGWVYKSGALETETPLRRAADTSLSAASTQTIALVIAALAQTFVLGVTIAAFPVTMGLRTLQALGQADHTR